jgi:hypothetical protein
MEPAGLFLPGLFRRYQSDPCPAIGTWLKSFAAVLTFMACSFVLAESYLVYAADGDALFIDSNGNVGIGTDQPREKLDVNGSMRAEKYTGDGSSMGVSGIGMYGNPSSPSLRELITDIISNMLPIGTIMAYGGDVGSESIRKDLEQRGWLVCNGESVSCEDYRELFDVIHNYYSGPPDAAAGNVCREKFQLPDIRGRFLRGVNYDATDEKDTPRDPDCREKNNCDKVGIVQQDALMKHSHGYRTNTWFWKEGKTGGRYIRGDHTTNSLHHDRTDIEGNSEETRPKNLHVNWIIRAKYITSQKR